MKSKFGSAFAAARKAGKKEFTFGGKRYNTKTAPTTPKKGPIPGARPDTTKTASVAKKPKGPIGTGGSVVGTGKSALGAGKPVVGTGGKVVGSGLTIAARAKKANAGGGAFAKMLGGMNTTPKTAPVPRKRPK